MSSIARFARRFCVLVAVAVCFASPVRAGVFHVSGGIREQYDSTTHFSLGDYDQTGAGVMGNGVVFDQNTDAPNQMPGLHSQANSLGDPFGLHAHAFAQVIKPFQSNIDTDPFARSYGVSATSNILADYSVTVSNPGVAIGTPVMTAYHMHLHGETLQGAGNTPDTVNMSRADAGAQANVRGIVNGVYSSPGGGSINRQINNGVESDFGTGLLVGFVNDADITCDPFTVYNGVPFTAEAFLQSFADAFGDYRESFTAEANSDFGNTLTFATDRPVFDLPDGYTANSADAGIVNNMFVVPEPASVVGAGLALVGLARRTRRSA